MIFFPDIDPVALRIGPLSIYWYGLSYLVGISIAWKYLSNRTDRIASGWDREKLSDVIFYSAVGGIIGGRLGYVLFYNAVNYLENPLSIFSIWEGGMSFHGGILGVIAALFWLSREYGRSFLSLTDFIVPAIPICLGLGRIANFVNQELWGSPTSQPWGVVFTIPAAGFVPRHPTQLYEALLEGLLLFYLLYLIGKEPKRLGVLSGWFLCLYGTFRCGVEFFREPDAHIGYLASSWLTMGQTLSFPMILAGLVLVLRNTASEKQ
jgi:phosphatidylglycerol---prolipoprotein diacylglyceryl transferase